MNSTTEYDNTTFNGTSSPLGGGNPALFEVAKGLVNFRKFAVCPVGILANILCVIVLTRGNLRRMMLLPYLVVLAVVDGLYLFSDLLNEIVGQSTLVTGSYCKFAMYTALTTGAYSDLIIVAMAVHRLIAVCLPLHAQRILTPKVSLVVIFILLIVVCAMYSVSLISYGVYAGHTWCHPLPEYAYLTNYEVILGLVKTVFCSFAILVVSIAIVLKLQINRSNIGLVRSNSSTESHVTLMLLCTTTLFLITNLPLSIYVFFQTFMEIEDDTDFFIYVLFLTLKAIGLTSDFFLYFLASSIFRAEVKRRFCWFSIKKKLESISSHRTHRNSNTQNPMLNDATAAETTVETIQSSYI